MPEKNEVPRAKATARQFALLGFLSLAVVLAVVLTKSRKPAQVPTPVLDTQVTETLRAGANVTSFAETPAGSLKNPSASTRPVSAISQIDPPAIVSSFARLEGVERLSAADAEEVARNVRSLIAQGGKAIPAISQYLDCLKDVALDGYGAQFRYPTLRTTLIDALHQIGGLEAVDLMVKTIRTSADPFEVGLLAKYIDQQAPGQFRTEIVEAARETLKMAAQQDQLEGRDVAPLFQALETTQQASVVQELEPYLKKWDYYSNMVLAGLQDEAGIPTLIQQVQSTDSAKRAETVFTWQMLAQVASRSPQAREALLQAASAGTIPDYAWNRIATGLGGDQYFYGDRRLLEIDASKTGFKTYHMKSSNENFYSLPVPTDSPDIPERQAIIDSLLGNRLGASAKDALQKARAELSGRPATK